MKILAGRNLVQTLSASPWITGLKAVQCSRSDCSRWLTQQHLASRKVGVTMHCRWFCSYACLAPTAGSRLLQLVATQQIYSPRISRMSLPLILISRGWLTHEHYKLATIEREQTGSTIEDVLVRTGYVSEKDLVAARSIQWDCPVLSAVNNSLSEEQQDTRIPLTLLRTHSMVPLHYVAATNTLFIGFIYGVEYAVLYAIERMTGCHTRACLISASDFEFQMQQRNHQPAPNDLTFDNVQGHSRMAHILCNYGALLSADDISIGRCREYLWARMTTPAGLSNILFKLT